MGGEGPSRKTDLGGCGTRCLGKPGIGWASGACAENDRAVAGDRPRVPRLTPQRFDSLPPAGRPRQIRGWFAKGRVARVSDSWSTQVQFPPYGSATTRFPLWVKTSRFPPLQKGADIGGWTDTRFCRNGRQPCASQGLIHCSSAQSQKSSVPKASASGVSSTVVGRGRNWVPAPHFLAFPMTKALCDKSMRHLHVTAGLALSLEQSIRL